MGKIEEGVSLTDSSISDAEVQIYLEGRYPEKMSERPDVLTIYPSDESDYDLRRGIQQETVQQVHSPRGMYRAVPLYSYGRRGRSPRGTFRKG